MNCTDSDINKNFDVCTEHLGAMLYVIFFEFPSLFIISINAAEPKSIDQKFQVNWLNWRKKQKQKNPKLRVFLWTKHIKKFHFKQASTLLLFILTRFYMFAWQSHLSSYKITFKKALMLLI